MTEVIIEKVPGSGIRKLRTCTCCGVPKPTASYTHNPRTRIYTPTCRDCGAWLFLLRKVFGRAVYMDRARDRQAQYARKKREASRPANAGGLALQNAWNSTNTKPK